MPPRPPPPPRTRLGCGFLVVSAILTCILLGINALIVTNAYDASRQVLPETLRHKGAEQAILFLGPVLFLFIEWWICDVAIDWLRPAPKN
jgi:hypothetical protein